MVLSKSELAMTTDGVIESVTLFTIVFEVAVDVV
jgi:hypothetical protein